MFDTGNIPFSQSLLIKMLNFLNLSWKEKSDYQTSNHKS